MLWILGLLRWRYSREVLFEVDMSRFARRLSASDLFRRAADGPLRSRIAWDHDRDRLVLLGGAALRFYRDVQRVVLHYLLVWPLMMLQSRPFQCSVL